MDASFYVTYIFLIEQEKFKVYKRSKPTNALVFVGVLEEVFFNFPMCRAFPISELGTIGLLLLPKEFF